MKMIVSVLNADPFFYCCSTGVRDAAYYTIHCDAEIEQKIEYQAAGAVDAGHP